MHWAVMSAGGRECVELLWGAGADVAATDSRERSALHVAAESDENQDVISTLVACLADVRARDRDGSEPIHMAIRGNSVGKLQNDSIARPQRCAYMKANVHTLRKCPCAAEEGCGHGR